jgi:hypothetical protein
VKWADDDNFCLSFYNSLRVDVALWISLLHSVVKRVRNRTARFHCVFSSTDGYGI